MANTSNSSNISYQSPICLNDDDVLEIDKYLHMYGTNTGAAYDESQRIFIVNDVIILRVGEQTYRLIEYHFHVPSEHIINDSKFASEIHYVFVEHDKNKKYEAHNCPDICSGCSNDISGNVLVIGRVITNEEESRREHGSLAKLQPRIPNHYFEYDGTLTTGDYSPVRWIVGRKPIQMKISVITDFAKTARSIQPLDGRIVLYSRSY
uniref:carbonic anhydrase n=1 Tax=viral metagenome TaxID=1070528 RepID=A0A6C0JJC4_9ZZZZ